MQFIETDPENPTIREDRGICSRWKNKIKPQGEKFNETEISNLPEKIVQNKSQSHTPNMGEEWRNTVRTLTELGNIEKNQSERIQSMSKKYTKGYQQQIR